MRCLAELCKSRMQGAQIERQSELGDTDFEGGMKKLLVIGSALAMLGAIGGCASAGDSFVYGSEVMSASEIAEYRTFIATAENPELQEGIAEHNAMVDQRAEEMGIALMTAAISRPSRGSTAQSRQVSTGSRLGRSSGSRTVAGMGGTAQSVTGTPDAGSGSE